ncbi:putative kinase inhibitor [Rubripirellula lacrimiformis]|uniref:Putative kinase inhibitor n=1 Tax=Rubripirellula lacrimiformis TaxID=1930273 RepID=A0A517ND03_9BACT|nr:YHYH protein [Rubripirellula lacrimiformis]QDT05014.1 putative kinase inhibitor [Rubripirellula lacrimiformis]
MTPRIVRGLTHRFLSSVFAIALTLGGSHFVFAHDGHDHGDSAEPKGLRTWTLDEEGAHLHGAFVTASGGDVQIRLDDNRLVTLKINRLVASDRHWIGSRLEAIETLNQSRPLQLVFQNSPSSDGIQAKQNPKAAPLINKHFQPFASVLKLRWDDKYFYVGSNGMPDHPMMIGIRSWQQQVPIPQKYFGHNAWRIPLHPVPAKQPMSTKNNFLRGAIALAVNGVPIFNPLNNRGDDALLFGELDQFGGHCGRADDYHYHIAPVHLQKTTGEDQPIAYALDGYPIFGYQDEQAGDFAPLDSLGGHQDADGKYHYHATKEYPYLNGGFYGEVVERGGQVDPQPRAEPIRPDLRPLRDATITEFTQPNPGSYRLVYDVRGQQGTVSYTLADDGSADFEFVDTTGRKTSQTYSRRDQRRNAPPIPGDDRPSDGGPPPPPPGPPRDSDDNRPPRGGAKRVDPPVDLSSMSRTTAAGFQVTSTSVDKKHFLSVDCTCDGAAQSPAITWKGAPAGTNSFAVNIWHTAPDQEKSYWVVYNIPAGVTSLKQNAQGVGIVGANDRGRSNYDPMCSKGPGLKKYHITVFALSEELRVSPPKATRANLQKAMKNILLGESTMDVLYER